MRPRAAVLVVCVGAAVAAHERERGAIGFIDPSGELVFQNAEIHEAGDFSGGLAVVRVHRDGALKFGYVDRTGAFAIDPKLDWAAPFAEGLAFASRRDERKRGYIGTRGQWEIDCGLEDGRAFSGGVAPVKAGGKWGFIDRRGAWIAHPVFDDADWHRQGRSRVKLGERWGFADRSGALVIPADLSYAGHFSDGLARVRRQNGPISFLDCDGKAVVAPLEGIAEAGDFHDGRALVRIKTRWGYIDRTGRMVILAEYDAGTPFSGGVAAVERRGKWLVIDGDGREKAPLSCEWTLGFQGGLAPILARGRMGFADAAGRIVAPAKHVRAYAFSEGLARVELE